MTDRIGPVPKNWDPRCQGFNTRPGVIYHAHDLPRCMELAVGTIDDHILCQRHIDAWVENHPTAGRTWGGEPMTKKGATDA